jgi:hypothetical protein
MSEGQAIYNGPMQDIKSYFKQNMGLTMPLFTNPSDYLIKLAIEPKIVDKDLTSEKLSI